MTLETGEYGKRRLPSQNRRARKEALRLQEILVEGFQKPKAPEYFRESEAGQFFESILGENTVGSMLEGRGLKADLRQGSDGIKAVVDCGELQAYEGRKKGGKRAYEYSLVSIDSLDEDSSDRLFAVLETIVDSLKPESTVFVIEQREPESEKPDKEKRGDILKRAGLVERTILIGNPEVVKWRSRTKKKGKRVPIDVTDQDSKHYWWAKGAWRKAAEGYRKRGYRIINPEDSEILGKLKATTNVLDTIHRVELGWGMIIVDQQGNRIMVTLDGIEMPIAGGPEHGTFGIPKKKKKR